MSKKFSKLVNERGFLNENAKKFVKESFGKQVEILLKFAETENEVRIIGSILNSVVGDMVSFKAQEIKNEKL